MKKKNITRMVCIDAVMIALYVVLKLIANSIPLGNIKITLAPIAIIVMALYFGVTHSSIVAFMGEFIFQLIGYGLTWTTALWGLPPLSRAVVICIILSLIMRIKNSKSITDIDAAEYLITIMISGFVATIFNTGIIALDAIIYHYYSYAYVFGNLGIRLLTMFISSVIYTLIAKAVIEALYKAKIFSTTAK